jgi:hypothetical protein
MPDLHNNYGLLLNKDIKLHRLYFKQMVKLLGINCQYRFPLTGKTYNLQGDLEANYSRPQTVGVIFQDHPDQKTLKKMGWVAELQEGSSIIHVPYDLEKLEVGALFEIPSGLDNAKPRLFRVISMQNIMVYPASIACEIAPEYFDTDEKTLVKILLKQTLRYLLTTRRMTNEIYTM